MTFGSTVTPLGRTSQASNGQSNFLTPVPSGRTTKAPSIIPSEAPSDTSSFFRRAQISGGTKKKLQETTKVSLVLLFPMLMLLGMTVNALTGSLQYLQEITDTILAINKSLEVAELVRNLQIERGRSAMFLSSNRSNMVIFDNLLKARDNTDYAIQMVTDWSFVQIALLANYTDPINIAFYKHLGKFRNLADIGKVPADEAVRFLSILNNELLGVLFKDVKAPNDYRYLVTFDNFGRAAEVAGILRALGAAFWLPCSSRNNLWILEVYSNHKSLLQSSFNYYPPLEAVYMRSMKLKEPLQQDIENMVNYIVAANSTQACLLRSTTWRLEMGLHFFNNMTTFINTLSTVKLVITDRMAESLNMQKDSSNFQVIVYSCVMVLVTVCTFGTMAIVYHMTSRVQKFTADIANKTDEVADEKRRTEMLLYQMMPRDVADQLLAGQQVQPEYFDCVTIYFSDVVGFTSISARSSPSEIIDLLNALYGTFDHILDKYDVYKVETIGDAYMVASGLPVRNGDRHATEIALMSLNLLRVIPDVAVAHIPNETLKLRIGLHSGMCAAGVVGIKMPRYCLFGDTVNTASRMESTGEALRIHCSEATLALLEKEGGFQTEVRGTIAVKGKGSMTTHWVVTHVSEKELKKEKEDMDNLSDMTVFNEKEKEEKEKI